ncbi:MAG: phosphoribosylformylglycinamidine synthase, partial [Planctomycetota bacterium]
MRQREPIAPVATTAGSENAVGKRARTSALVESRIYLIAGALARADIETITRALLCDPVSEEAEVVGDGEAPSNDPASFEVHLKPGVMDPVAETLRDELTAEGYAVESVRTARRFRISGAVAAGEIEAVARGIANDCIEDVYFAPPPIAPPPKPPERSCELQTVEIRSLGDDRLVDLSRSRHLFLSLEEMQAIRRHFQSLGREPTDLELETIAQTWSEHCVHKTLKSAVRYEGDAIPSPHANAPSDAPASGASAAVYEFDNLLKDTIARATQELIAAGRGPECLSVFEDNAGVIAFDERYGVAFKVETHNHPSAIEPYGGAATGIGGCIRDVLGCGLGARPIANTDVFCVAPGDWPTDAVPRGALHPARVLDGVVRGVADYGNRMGIPTVNGAVLFHPRYLGNPLVFCGCAGLLPRDRIRKAARPGDRIVLLGGRTGRDGIHGATFSSAELSDGHADEFSHAVQIGNA